MKKWLVFVLAALISSSVIAEEESKKKGKEKKKKETTLENYLAYRKGKAEETGKEFDKEKAEKDFKRKDKNGDGVISEDEKGKKK